MKKIITALILCFILVWLSCPLSETQVLKFAEEEKNYLFSDDKINPNLFSGPVYFFEDDKKWIEWFYTENNSKALIRVHVSIFRFIPIDHYMSGSDELWNKIYLLSQIQHKK